MPTNHHDVLGIRPNAGREEIELAYKGRRSQYHPDRYAQADAETQAWATACMQEVNVAYAALTSAKGTVPDVGTVKSRRPAPAAGWSREDFERAFKAQSISSRMLTRLFVAPNIPTKKLLNALESYGGGLARTQVLALVDETVLGSGKDGLLLTNEELRTKAAFSIPHVFKLDGIRVSAKGRTLFINGETDQQFNFLDAEQLDELVSAIDAALTAASRPAEFVDDSAGSVASKQSARSAAPHATQPRPSKAAAGYRLEHVFLEIIEVLDQARRQVNPVSSSGRKSVNMIALMEVALALTDKLQDATEQVRGAPPDAEDLAWLRSDPVRLELMTYQFAWLTHSLRYERGRSDAQIDHDLELFVTVVIAPSLTALMAVDGADHEQMIRLLEGSPLKHAFGVRLQHYMAAIGDRGTDIGVLLFQALADPVAFAANPGAVDGLSRERWEATARGACGFNSLSRLAAEMHHVLGMGLDATFGPAS